ncbi:MAG TPA: pectate lyase, partial [Gillisia sp.]|nr:pectate lyase [Gillisia sp.]
MIILSTHILWAQKNRVSWREALDQPESWYGSEEAQRIADNVILYQNNNGGWLKNVDMADQLSASEIAKLKREKFLKSGTTIDNGATHTQLRYLAKVYDAAQKPEYKEAFLKGLDFLLEAQYENGGWPQFYPVKKGYSEHITFNDDAMMGVMNLLRDIAYQKEPYQFVNKERCEKSKIAIDKGLEIILKTQVETDGKLTVWGAQHDKDDLKPANARAYELASLSGKESVMIVEYLMGIEEPGEDVINAIRSAVKWFEENKIMDIEMVW